MTTATSLATENTKYVIGVQYDGGGLHGWQAQPGQQTVQGLLETAVGRVADHSITLAVAGRTDAGVHATGQVATFESSARRECHEWLRGINALTPSTILVSWVRETHANFHPRYSATARRYLYVFYDAAPNPFVNGLAWATQSLDADVMHRQAQDLLGEHDFTSFRAAGCQSLTPRRRVDRCEVRRTGAYVVLDIEANAFLLHMVRNIARALVDIGQRKVEASIGSMLLACDRNQIGATAPPQGLYLYQVRYPEESFPGPVMPPILTAT